MTDPSQSFLKGQFLTAMPSLADPNFSYTVTCICEHNAEGAVGLIINRIHPFLSCKDIFEELKVDYKKDCETIPVYVGGPVHTGDIFILHGSPFEWGGCLMITPDLAMSNTKDIVNAIALGNGPELFAVVLGCAGWGKGQLEYEIMQNAWLSCPLENKVIFHTPVEDRWKEVMNIMGIDPALLSDMAGNA